MRPDSARATNSQWSSAGSAQIQPGTGATRLHQFTKARASAIEIPLTGCSSVPGAGVCASSHRPGPGDSLSKATKVRRAFVDDVHRESSVYPPAVVKALNSEFVTRLRPRRNTRGSVKLCAPRVTTKGP